ncbi:TIGR03111 family XrtG-associated glycosyltransferase [Ligilactobacillus apodemi]|uniref:Glycosyltransferase n=1 Tax=Ligilactobacillus apodemi DSM 16634 = JCM 16172 TaxID=1423724 RepID=A0A0R1U6E1_9LACO|nr:TIGR03111 family XrtG-associated glycosyltransferase [Ligilactobacillus apodemi]KRL86578.1 glycosyltransferase [Ligilactobacillus apodemi DSM 16634 = JCM 16172]MCR1901723.1 putative glycosyltransferase, exosortase G system-associated [Ligilactobacillus apodemi]
MLILSRFGFWLSWLLLPLLFEIIPALAFFCQLLWDKRKKKHTEPLLFYPYITVIIPVYNSQDTLYRCLRSLANSLYPTEQMQVIIANNGSTDQSFLEFERAQQDFPALALHWLNTDNGKARALNSAIYSAWGQYIINIDSDGVLEKHALTNIITHFENDLTVEALTGAILINKKSLRQTSKWSLLFLRSNEYFEYIQAFLTGRRIETSHDQLFTLSGAFSAFRKKTLLETFLYDPHTVGEDTEITFQIRETLKRKIALCPNAIFYTEPLESLGKLYLQRQRWQRGQIETVQSFMHQQASIKTFFSNFMVRKMILDHTFIFCRIIWIFGLAILIYLGYSPKLLVASLGLLYLLYVFNSCLSLWTALIYLKLFPKERRFLLHKAWTVFTLPLYNFFCALVRLLGIINSIVLPAQWNTIPFSQECHKVKKIMLTDLKKSLERNKPHDQKTSPKDH